MREIPPGPAKDLARLRAVARKRAALEDEFVALTRRLREYDPPVRWSVIADAGGFQTAEGAMNLLRRHDERAAKAKG